MTSDTARIASQVASGTVLPRSLPEESTAHGIDQFATLRRHVSDTVSAARPAPAAAARMMLADANLARISLCGIDLADSNLAGTNLTGANMAGANLAGGIALRGMETQQPDHGLSR